MFKSLWKFIIGKALPTNSPLYIKTKLDKLFKYIDQSKGDTVKHYAAEYYKNIPFKDDCDGYARTAAMVLIREKYRLRNIFLIKCITWKGELHMVCMLVEGRDIWVFDNLEPRLVKVQEWFKNIQAATEMRAILQPYWEPFNADNFPVSR